MYLEIWVSYFLRIIPLCHLYREKGTVYEVYMQNLIIFVIKVRVAWWNTCFSANYKKKFLRRIDFFLLLHVHILAYDEAVVQNYQLIDSIKCQMHLLVAWVSLALYGLSNCYQANTHTSRLHTWPFSSTFHRPVYGFKGQ